MPLRAMNPGLGARMGGKKISVPPPPGPEMKPKERGTISTVRKYDKEPGKAVRKPIPGDDWPRRFRRPGRPLNSFSSAPALFFRERETAW